MVINHAQTLITNYNGIFVICVDVVVIVRMEYYMMKEDTDIV